MHDEPETVVEVDTARLAAHGLTVADVEHALEREHMRVEAQGPNAFVVHVAGSTPPTIVLDIVIEVHEGAPIRVSDVARISTKGAR